MKHKRHGYMSLKNVTSYFKKSHLEKLPSICLKVQSPSVKTWVKSTKFQQSQEKQIKCDQSFLHPVTDAWKDRNKVVEWDSAEWLFDAG